MVMCSRKFDCIRLQVVLKLSDNYYLLGLFFEKVFSIQSLPVHQETTSKTSKNSLISETHSLKMVLVAGFMKP